MQTRSLKRKRKENVSMLEEVFPSNWVSDLTTLIFEYTPVINFRTEELLEAAKTNYKTSTLDPECCLPKHISLNHNLFHYHNYQEILMEELESTFSQYLTEAKQIVWLDMFHRGLNCYRYQEKQSLESQSEKPKPKLNFIRTFIPLLLENYTGVIWIPSTFYVYKLFVCVILIVFLAYDHFRYYIMFLEKSLRFKLHPDHPFQNRNCSILLNMYIKGYFLPSSAFCHLKRLKRALNCFMTNYDGEKVMAYLRKWMLGGRVPT